MAKMILSAIPHKSTANDTFPSKALIQGAFRGWQKRQNSLIVSQQQMILFKVKNEYGRRKNDIR